MNYLFMIYYMILKHDLLGFSPLFAHTDAGRNRWLFLQVLYPVPPHAAATDGKVREAGFAGVPGSRHPSSWKNIGK